MSNSPRAGSSRTEGLFAAYRGMPGLYDESVDANGALRPHWRALGDTLDKLGREELAIRSENARRIIREHGITYNIYSDPQGMDRPWELDVIPLLISAQEWRTIERGLTQR